jgi:site-specific recombinase XerD
VPTGVHILRHTFGAHLTTRGAVQRARQDLLGHRSAAMTERYSHLSPGSLADAITLLERREPPNGEMLETTRRTGTKTSS